MRTFLLTTGIMVKRALNRIDLRWLCGLLPVTVLLLTPASQIPCRMVSVSAILPPVFLLVGWTDSKSRRGLLSILFRTDSYSGIRISEILLPALAGMLLSMATAILVRQSPPWQFWVTAPLAAISFTFILNAVERKMRFPGRAVLSLLWIYGISRPDGLSRAGEILVFTEYPGGVLFTDTVSGGMHPDSFIIAALVVALISAGIYSLLTRGE